MSEEWDLEADWKMIRPQPVPDTVWLVSREAELNEQIRDLEQRLSAAKTSLISVQKDLQWVKSQKDLVSNGLPRETLTELFGPFEPNPFSDDIPF
jgi:hypothetical protein